VVTPGQVVTARDWTNVEGKRFLVQQLFDADDWGRVAWVTVYEPEAIGAPMSRVIPIDRMTVDEVATEDLRRWREDRSSERTTYRQIQAILEGGAER
jgi:hypothetical protein